MSFKVTIDDPPTLNKVLKDHPRILAILMGSGFKSLITLTFMSRDWLMNELGLTANAADTIKRVLKDHGLRQYVAGEHTIEFIDELFGCIDDAPILVMQVRISRHPFAPPRFAPLDSIERLAEIDPEMRVSELIDMSVSEVLAMASPTTTRELGRVMSRLDCFGLSLSPEVHPSQR